MFAKSAIVSLAVVAAAAPAFSAPIPAESRALKLPAGAVGDLIKSLGKGILSGGAVTGLLSLLDGGSDDSTAAPAARDLDLEARSLASVLEKLVGAGEESLESVLKKAIIGGAASGVAVEGVNAATGQSKRGIPAAVVDDAAKVAEKGIGSIIGNGAADGIGSALGGLGIGAIISKLFGGSDDSTAPATKRGFQDLTDEEVNTLLEYIGQMNSPSKRAAINSSVGKGLAGVVAGLAATQGAESIIEEIKSLFKKEVSLNELD
ncbi:hypothetical protein DFH08DRAFT_843880 [Mycena albidolilacea]|uniref:Uncharacterized protein n=1 Tax=Mycena albidolilacea TaxID=1033008 RepID=A0AAD7EZT6_9AGAR|nr:hypothetical protein DFH08DRAFT_843880 [Mycena albidolilacea]